MGNKRVEITSLELKKLFIDIASQTVMELSKGDGTQDSERAMFAACLCFNIMKELTNANAEKPNCEA